MNELKKKTNNYHGKKQSFPSDLPFEIGSGGTRFMPSSSGKNKTASSWASKLPLKKK